MEAINAYQSDKRYSIDEYFAIEYSSEIRHEYWDGHVVAIAGGSTEHARICFNVTGEFARHLRGKTCRGYSNDLRIGVPPMPFFYYPDLSVVCGPLEFDSRDPKSRSVVNPTLLVEVLSPSTERYDRTDKFDAYSKLPSLQEYVLVSQDRARVETFFQHPDGSWVLNHVIGIDAVIHIRSLKIEIKLNDLYADVPFPPPTPPPHGSVMNIEDLD